MPTDDPNKLAPPAGPFNPKATMPSSSRYGAGAPEGKPVAKADPLTVKQRALDPSDPDVASQILNGIRDVNAGMGDLKRSHEGVADKVLHLVQDVAELKEWRKTGANRSYSGQIEAVTDEVKIGSQHNLKQDSVIGVISGDLTVAKEDLAKAKDDLATVKQDLAAVKASTVGLVKSQTRQTEILEKVFTEAQEWTVKLTVFWNSTPMKIVRYVVGAFLIGWAAKNNIHIGSP